MYTKHNLLPAKVVATDRIKPELASVAFYGNRTIATDTFRLLEVSATGDAHEPRIIFGDYIKVSKFDGKTIKFDLSHIESVLGQKAEATDRYPDIDRIMAEDTTIEYATVKVNARMLGDLLVQMSKLGKFAEVEMKVPVNQTYKPIHIYAHDSNPNQSERQTAHGLMMPMTR